MTSTLSRRDRQKIARREAILQAARQVFLSGSPFQATIETVAREANISKGTVYLYFSGKEALLAELLREGLLLLEAQLVAAYAAQEALSPDVRVGRVAGAYLEFAQAQPDYIRLSIAFESGQIESPVPADLADEIRSLSRRGVELIAQAVREGIDGKVFRHTDPRRVADALWSALNGALLMTGVGQGTQLPETQPDELFQTTLEIFLRALKRTR